MWHKRVLGLDQYIHTYMQHNPVVVRVGHMQHAAAGDARSHSWDRTEEHQQMEE